MALYLTKKELSTIAGYTYRRLHDIDMGLPDGGKLFVKGESGKYDLALFVQRWVQYNVDNESEGDQSLDDAKTRHEIIKTRKTELEVARLEGRLVDVYAIRKLWGSVASTVMQTMLRLPSKIAPRLVMQSNVDVVSSIIDDEIRTALQNIAETPLPDDIAAEEDGDAEDDEEG